MRRRSSKKARGGGAKVVIKRPFNIMDPADAYVPQWRRAVPRYGTVAAGDRYGMSWTSSSDEQKVNRMRDRYRGMGAYYGGQGGYGGVNRMKKAQKWSGFAQGLVKSGQSMLSGSGEYEYNSTFPAATGGAGTPDFSSIDDELGAICVSFKEYLTDIYGNMVDETTVNNFSEVQYSINPGLERSFPFLSQFAANFDEYEMKQLVYTYKSTINTDSSTTNGQVGIRKGALDPTNKARYLQGRNFEFNGTPQDFWQGSYNSIPGSAFDVLGLMNNEIESLTGVKSFSGGITGSSLGPSATAARGAMDATAVRRMNIVRNIAENLVKRKGTLLKGTTKNGGRLSG